MCIQGERFERYLFLMCALSSARTSPPVILRVSGKASSKGKPKFEERIAQFKHRLRHRNYPDNLVNMSISEECRLR